MQYRTVNGERTLTNVGGSWPQTDARGGYRAYGLPPGDYIVCAYPPATSRRIPQDCRPGGGGEGAREVAAAEVQWARQQIQAGGRGGAFTGAPPTPAPAPGQSVAVGPVFYPAATSASNATPITLGRGEERAGIDLMMTRSATARVIGDHSWIGRAAGGRRRRALLGWLRDDRNHRARMDGTSPTRCGQGRTR